MSMMSDLILAGEPFVLAASHVFPLNKFMIMKVNKKRLTFFALGLIVVLAVALQVYNHVGARDVAGFNRDLKNYNAKLQIFDRNSNKVASFKIAIADDDEKRMYGLMFLDKLPEEYGMLFPFKNTQIVTMWMKNTPLSLDMIFIDADDEVSTIVENTKPNSFDLISSKREVKYVLEVNAGTAQKLGIEARQKVQILR